MSKKMCQRQGDGSLICSDCWSIEHPDTEEPEINWILGVCSYCEKEENE
jgi:hypothetical protein